MLRFGVCSLALSLVGWTCIGCGASSNTAGAGGATASGGSANPNGGTHAMGGASAGVGGTSHGGATSSGGANPSGGSVAAGGTNTPSGGNATGGTSSAGSGNGGGAGAANSGGAANGSGGSTSLTAGIAANYPNDTGIENDPAVLFADDFESYAQPADLNNRWDAVYQNELVKLTTDPLIVYAGTQSLEFDMPVQAAELSDATDKIISPEQDDVYLRYYSRFVSPFDVVGSSHNGSSMSAHYFINGQATPGVPADGMNKFLVALENWRGDATVQAPGVLNLYVYHPEQRDVYGDHFFTTGLVSPNTSLPYDFGPDFVPHPDIIQEMDRWYCYEYRIKANTPGTRDGEITIWLDGNQIVSFKNLRLRDVPTLKIDRFGLSLHIHDNPNGEQKYFDNVVAATQYIGPMAK